MAERFINIEFPFQDDNDKNYFLKMNKEGKKALKSDLMHLLLTTPGDRLYLPDFGTNLRKFIFEQNDSQTYLGIKEEIQTVINKYIPNLKLTELKIDKPEDGEYDVNPEYAAVVRIDYIYTEGALSESDFVQIVL
jgi:phage baseplate assembly protein W